MKRKIVKMTAYALALVLAAAPLTGCQRTKKGATLEMNMSNSWHNEMTLQNVSHVPKFGIGTRVLCSTTTDTGVELMWYDTQTGSREYFEPLCMTNSDPLSRYQCSVIQMPDQKIGIVCMEYRNKGGGEFDVLRRFTEVYDWEMNYMETVEMPLEFFDESYFHGTDNALDSKGNWYCTNYNPQNGVVTLQTYNSDFQKYGEVEPPSQNFDRLFNGADGTVYASFWFYDDNYNAYTKIYKLDAEARTCKDIGLTIPNGANHYEKGTQGYDFYYSTANGLYGVKDDEAAEIIDWVNSDFSSGSIDSFCTVDNGDFLLHRFMDNTYWYAKPRTQEEMDHTKLISLAAVEMTEELEKAVIDYNREETGYRIVVKDYADYNTWENPNIGYETMKKDMLDGVVADMICTDGVNFESLASKGLFGDWYALMDADEEFDRGNYLTNFFEAYEYDGELQRLGISYTIGTGIAKTQFAGDTQGQSLGEILNLPISEGMDRFRYEPAERMAMDYMRNFQTGCINRKTAECCFDSPEFVQFLELLASIPMGDRFYEAEIASHCGEPFKNDKALLDTENLLQPIDFRGIRRATFGDADVTLVGYPMVWDEGNGGVFNAIFTVSINVQSKEQDAIWDFMKHLLSENYQKCFYECMPVHTGALEYKLNEAEHMVTATYGMYPLTVNIGPMEEWETDLLRDYINGIRTSSYHDETVYGILMEEAEKLLAGEQSPEETAKMMQSRVGIYLSEQS